jgi:AcrR family transcriptional regulator
MPYRPTEKTEARKASTREAIVAAALDQVAERGFGSAGVQVVAARAGVATGTVYRHFGSKAELFAEVFDRAAEHELHVLERIAAQSEGSVVETIRECVEVFARRALAGRVLAHAQLVEPVDPRVEEERLRLRRGYRDHFARLLRAGIERGELPEQDVEVVAAAVIGAIAEALVGPLSQADGGRGNEEALVSAIGDFCLSAVQAPR